MTYAATVLAKNPTVYHRFEETTGLYLDSSPNGHNGSAGTAVVRGVAGLIVDGGNAAQFSNTGGANSGVGISPTATVADETSYSLEAWVKTSAAGSSNRYIAGGSGGSGANTYSLLYTINGVPHMEARNTASTAFNANSTVSINDNFTHHLVGVFDTTTDLVLLYVDGVLIDTTATTGTIRGGRLVNIGNISSGSGPFGGVIDEVAFYPVALTAAQVLENYEAGAVVLDTSTEMYYFSAQTASPVSPAIQGTYDMTGSMLRKKLITAPVASDNAVAVGNDESIAAVVDLLGFQHTSDGRAADRTLAGTITAVVQGKEGQFGADAVIGLHVSVVSNDGSTTLGVLGEAVNSLELPIIEASRTVTIPITPLVAPAGSRLCVESFTRHMETTTNARQSYIRVCATTDSGAVDHIFADGESITSPTKRTWIKLTLIDPPGTPTGLTESATIDTATLSWSASTGDVEGYDVRIDGGSIVDVGNVLTHDFTGLAPATTYTLEVRAYGTGGDSEWASIPSTTGSSNLRAVANRTAVQIKTPAGWRFMPIA